MALCSRLVVVFLRNGSPRQLGQVLHATHETLAVAWLLMVTLLTMGGLVREKAVGSSSFTLSLPVSRLRLMSVRIGMGVLEAIALAVCPWIAMLFTAKVAGNAHFISQAGFHVFLLLGGGLLFFGVALLVSSLVQGEYTAPLVGFSVIAVAAYELNGPKFHGYTPWSFMLGSDYFQWRSAAFTGPVPWVIAGTFVAVAALLAMVSIKVVQQRDF
jgi:ABC-2 type transport system permease protein